MYHDSTHCDSTTIAGNPTILYRTVAYSTLEYSSIAGKASCASHAECTDNDGRITAQETVAFFNRSELDPDLLKGVCKCDFRCTELDVRVNFRSELDPDLLKGVCTCAFRCTLQMCFSDAFFRCTFQMRYAGMLYRCTPLCQCQCCA